eukprot:gene29629-33341_t
MIMASTHIHHPDLPGNTSAHTPSGGSQHAKSDHPAIAPGEIAIGVIIGRASEYFDFFVYAIASVLVFPTVFFPFKDHLAGTLYAFVIFSFAFIARPFGTVIFMAIQKKLGREVKLTLALFLLYADRDRPDVATALRQAVPLLPRYVLLALVVTFPVNVASLLLIPGLYLKGRLMPVGPAFVAERPLGVIAAWRRSFALTRGHGLTLMAFACVPLIA